ncbi:MAG: trypsin-like peptidase domain-containing protein [Lapillicoccus sp.]
MTDPPGSRPGPARGQGRAQHAPGGGQSGDDWFFAPSGPGSAVPGVEATQPITTPYYGGQQAFGGQPSYGGQPSFGGQPSYGGQPSFGGQPPRQVGPSVAGGPRSRTGALIAGASGVALVSALLGGGVVLAGEKLLAAPGSGTSSPLPPPASGTTSRPEGSIANIAARALPSVVTIKVKGTDGAGTGSGFVMDKDGHVLTNNHVVSSVADSGTIMVLLPNNSSVPATIIGRDASYDLAVLRIDRTDIVPLQFGASADVVVGDGVIAVGAPLGLDATVTSGIVSAINRPVTPGGGDEQSFINAIQTDAAINPGNSGGPLLDMNGKVIGVNSAIARIPGSSSGTGGNIGVGFSIPSDQASRTAQQLITTGRAEHPVIGVRVDRSYDGDGAKVADPDGVAPGGPAEKAGLRNGDVITEFGGRKVRNADQLVVAIRSRNVGDSVSMKVKRGSETLDVTMTLQAATG